MNKSSLPLPFPVSDAADLRRAIRYVDRHGDESSRRYVKMRARALQRTDMLPAAWRDPKYAQSNVSPSLDEQFDNQAHKCGISAAKLKAIYLRGVNDFINSDIELGSATMWGLARVQRFINGDTSLDADLVGCAVDPIIDPGVEISLDSGAILADVLYASGEETAALFSPGEVLAIRLEDSTLLVEGILDGAPWQYALDTQTGAQDLVIN